MSRWRKRAGWMFIPGLIFGLTIEAQAAEELTRLLPEPGYRVILRGTCGKLDSGLDIDFDGSSGKSRFSLRAVSILKRLPHHSREEAPQLAEFSQIFPEGMTDAGLSLILTGSPGLAATAIRRIYFIRPDIIFYSGEDLEKVRASWASYPAASRHRFSLSLVRQQERLELWIDGHYFGSLGGRNWSQVLVKQIGACELEPVLADKDSETEKYLPLDLSVHRQSGTKKVLENVVAPGWQKIFRVPFLVVSPDNYLDTGCARWLDMAVDSDRFYDPYYRRRNWDNLPETIIRSIPRRYYRKLYLLAAVDPEGSPEMAVRVARYRQTSDGAGGTQADVNLRIDPVSPENCRVTRIGQLKVASGNQVQSLPFYLVEIPLSSLGELVDYLHGQDLHPREEPADFFYLEFTRKLEVRVKTNWGVFEKKPLGAKCGVYVFGATLEKIPVEIFVGSEEPGNVFYQHQNPALTVEIKNLTQSELPLVMTGSFTNFFGQQKRIIRRITAAAGKEGRFSVSLAGFEPGWYHAEFSFSDRRGDLLWKQPLNLAILPPDTRKATFHDQPHYGTWWFGGRHYTSHQPDKVLTLINRMGFRHIGPELPAELSREKLESYGITPSMMGWGHLQRLVKNPEELEKAVRSFVEKWPNTEAAMIFHETGGLPLGIGLPPELLGEKPPVFEGPALERRNQLIEQIKLVSGIIRRVAPQMKIILGNGATNFNVHWLREKLPRAYWDMLGMEMAMQSLAPEGQPQGGNLQAYWIAEQMKKIYGYEEMPVSSCFEHCYRSTGPGAFTLKRQADWYTRDVLHMLGYRLPYINLSGISEINSSYFTSRWGMTALTARAPLLWPKPAYVALATLTRVLDLAKYQRYLDTGSHSLYCLEFSHGNRYVYACWVTRGEYQADILFEKGSGQYQLIDLMGRGFTRKHQGKASLTFTESATYLVTETKIASVRPVKPIHPPLPLVEKQVVARLITPENWKMKEGRTEELEKWCPYQPVVKGSFILEQTQEGLKLTLQPDGKVPEIVGQYVTLELDGEPLPIPGKPEAIGLWVNGQANSARIIFEVIDADGRRWTSLGWEEEPYSWDMSDWEGETSVNFDGWCFISLPLPLHYGSIYYKPGFRHWRCLGNNSKENQLKFPLRLKRIHVIMREKLVYVNRMQPARSLSVQLRDLTVGRKNGQ